MLEECYVDNTLQFRLWDLWKLIYSTVKFFCPTKFHMKTSVDFQTAGAFLLA